MRSENANAILTFGAFFLQFTSLEAFFPVEIELPTELRPPDWLTGIQPGYAPFYSESLDLKQFELFLEEFIKREENQPNEGKMNLSEDEKQKQEMGQRDRQLMDVILDNSPLDCNSTFENKLLEKLKLRALAGGNGGNLTFYCSGNIEESETGKEGQLTSEWDTVGASKIVRIRHCHGTTIIWPLNWNASNGGDEMITRQLANAVQSNVESAAAKDCGNAKWMAETELIKVKFVENLQIDGRPRYYQQRGRFYCPSEVTCIGEMLFRFAGTGGSPLSIEEIALNVLVLFAVVALSKVAQPFLH